jgi:hypothetical protein
MEMYEIGHSAQRQSMRQSLLVPDSESRSLSESSNTPWDLPSDTFQDRCRHSDHEDLHDTIRLAAQQQGISEAQAYALAGRLVVDASKGATSSIEVLTSRQQQAEAWLRRSLSFSIVIVLVLIDMYYSLHSDTARSESYGLHTKNFAKDFLHTPCALNVSAVD